MNWSWDSANKVHQWRLLFNNWTLIKSGNKQYTSSRSPLPPNFLCKEILFKLLTFRYAITRKSEESSPRKSLPVLYTPSVGPSRLRILSPLIHKEGHWFELLHERRTEPAPLWWLPERSTRCIKNSFQLPRRTLTPCHISNDQALVCVCNLDNKPKIGDPYSKFNVRSKNNAHMQLLLSFITCLCICFSIFNGVTSLKQVPFFTEKKIEKLPRGSSYTLSLRTENFNSNFKKKFWISFLTSARHS